jgi:GNAT superfamily N-acetyltransferase
MSLTEYTIRAATSADSPVLGALRAAMASEWAEADQATPNRLAALTANAERYYADQLERGVLRAWLAISTAGQPAATASALLLPYPPSLRRLDYSQERLVAYIFGVYTVPAHRRQGLARRLMDEICVWGRAAGIDRLELRTSPIARPLYESLGFEGFEMLRLRLRE